MPNQLLGTSFLGSIGLLTQSSVWLDIAIDVTIKGTFILLIAAGLVYSFRRSAASRHMIWSLALGSFLALPLLAVALPRWQVAILPASMGRSAGNSTQVNRAADSIAPERRARHESQSTSAPLPFESSAESSTNDATQPLSWT